VSLPPRAPVEVVELEVSSPLDDQLTGWQSAAMFTRAQALIRCHGKPLGIMEIADLPGIDTAGLLTLVERAFGPEIRRRRCAVPSPQPELPPADLPPATVVVTTCGGDLEPILGALRSVLDMDYPGRLEVLLVDNRPATSGLAGPVGAQIPDPRLRIVPEPRRGLSAARNRGLLEATGDVVAFTDDDVVVDRHWLSALVGALVEERADCATGLILPSELRTPAQLMREELGGFGKGFSRRVFEADGSDADPMYPYSPGLYGSGASAAFRRGALREMGGFDEALGAGTKALGGEDLDIYLSCILAGRRLVYEPAAMLRHRHHPGEREFRRQVLHYGAGLSAMLTKRFLLSAQERRAITRRLPLGLRMLTSQRTRGTATAPRLAAPPRSLAVLQIVGMLYGPIAYLRSRRALATLH
jgi:cellulose synthase/poly-beta-1,6-N-acetylglucosamine synthase-like glycosyltransferase